MTERERIREQAPQGTMTRPFVRLEIRFRDGALYCLRWPIDDEHAPQWRGTFASSSPFMWAVKFSIKWREFFRIIWRIVSNLRAPWRPAMGLRVSSSLVEPLLSGLTGH